MKFIINTRSATILLTAGLLMASWVLGFAARKEPVSKKALDEVIFKLKADLDG